MKIIHSWTGSEIKKEIDNNLSFLLTNHFGNYFSLASQSNSRYNGWFLVPPNLVGKKIFKTIENINPFNSPEISEIHNNFWNIERIRDEIKESFFLPFYLNSLVYETNRSVDIELFLDIKESYDNNIQNNSYKISNRNNIILIKYSRAEMPTFFLAIKTDGEESSRPDQYVLKKYPLDQNRGSHPFERYVYQALKIKAKKIVFSVSENKNQAIKEASEVFENIKKLKSLQKKELKKTFKRVDNVLSHKNIDKETQIAFLCNCHSLSLLSVQESKKYNHIGIYAGLPWFFQFWSRDELISLRALDLIDPILAKKIILKLIKNINKDGNLPTTSCQETSYISLANKDGIGWLFKRISNLIPDKRFNKKEIQLIKTSIKKAIDGLLKNHTRNGFAINDAQETWMDSQKRAGATIEMQALRLNIYKLAYKLTNESKYFSLEKELRKKVKEKFWNGNILSDGLNPDNGISDSIIRPNLFLAAYIYPELLTKREWIKCFENSLDKLWLEWGGLTTIDKTIPSFISKHTGECPQSYHNGDSWFYINNLVALVLYRFDKKKFKKYIDKILQASTKEILWHGAIGHHAELSSADKFKPEGCWAQAWSSALYIELIFKIFSNSKS
ncbi:MAG: amylo-alpha-1,6-glucosidase [Patescibacteria group bacterium]|nr:amylo-alpha-1,6-glucosidase [Patescibacteria group bacterium]